jgi:hypothetical protein
MNKLLPFLLFAISFPLYGNDSLQPIVVLSGADTKIVRNAYLKIDSQAEWESIWLEHVGYEKKEKYDYYFNTANIPEVNFEKYMVITIFQSPGKANAGIKAVSIIEKEKEIIFDFEDKVYQYTAGSIGPGNAYGFFVLPHSDKKIIIREKIETLISRANKEPPIYKVVVTID